MKRITFLLLFISFIITSVHAQEKDCSCETDLEYLDGKIRKTPAYKTNKKAYEATYSNILDKAGSNHSYFDCYTLLNELLIPLNDNHSRVYGIEPGATSEVRSDPDKMDEFKRSAIFKAYYKPTIDLDSLKSVLYTRPKNDMEGIYSHGDYMSIGVYKNGNKNNYNAIILKSELETWQKGEVIFTLTPFGNNYLLAIGGSITSKRFIAFTERVEDGFFYFMGFQKDIEQTNYSVKFPSDSTYYREELSDNITYLKIGSFNSWYPTLSDAEKFYKKLEGNLNKDNLIIDLRNNGGGGDRNSDMLYKLIKDYAKTNKVYVLINHRTVSNAEQFAHRLSKLENCQLFGMRTNGTLAYEIKDSQYTLPCGKFKAVLTSKKHSEYLKYESKGIEPTVKFDMNTDWIEQLKNYIENNN